MLWEKLELRASELTVIDGPLGMGDVMELQQLDRPDLKDAPFTPRTPAFLKDSALFDTLHEQDMLVHHPYDSFNSVIDFIRFAADDPRVLAIKQTLYRVGKGADSPVVQTLLRAV